MRISDRLEIPEEELEISFSRSGGAGGQNVNKVNSKATLRFALMRSQALPEDVKGRFAAKYGSRLTQEGEIVLQGDRFRDQAKNVDDVRDRLVQLIRDVLVPPRKRRPTKPTRGSVERRLKAKGHHQTKKEGRRKPNAFD